MLDLISCMHILWIPEKAHKLELCWVSDYTKSDETSEIFPTDYFKMKTKINLTYVWCSHIFNLIWCNYVEFEFDMKSLCLMYYRQIAQKRVTERN